MMEHIDGFFPNDRVVYQPIDPDVLEIIENSILQSETEYIGEHAIVRGYGLLVEFDDGHSMYVHTDNLAHVAITDNE